MQLHRVEEKKKLNKKKLDDDDRRDDSGFFETAPNIIGDTKKNKKPDTYFDDDPEQVCSRLDITDLLPRRHRGSRLLQKGPLRWDHLDRTVL